MALPCPFCGGNDLLLQSGTRDREGVPIAVVCVDCGATGPWEYVQPSLVLTMDNNIERAAIVTGWNERVF